MCHCLYSIALIGLNILYVTAWLQGSIRSTETSVKNTFNQNFISKGDDGKLSRNDFCKTFLLIFPDGSQLSGKEAVNELQAFLRPNGAGSTVSATVERAKVTNLNLNEQSTIISGKLLIKNKDDVDIKMADFCGRYLCEVRRESNRQKMCMCSISGLDAAFATFLNCDAL